MYSATHKRIILVTSASESVGAEVAQQFSGADTHVVVNYRSDADRAELVAEAIRVRGGHATTICADVSNEADTAAMVDAIATRFGRLDTVVLNASGNALAPSPPGEVPRAAVELDPDTLLARDDRRHKWSLAGFRLPERGGRVSLRTDRGSLSLDL